MFPDDHAAEDQDVVRTVEEEALFRVAYPGIVDLYIKEKEETEENKNKSMLLFFFFSPPLLTLL